MRIQEAQKDGLDAIAVTEHIEYQSHKEDIPHKDRNRSYELSKKYAEKSDLLVIAGTEITKSMPPGHSNAIFVKDVNKIINDDYMDAHLAARKQGAFVFWNHPHWIGQRKDGSVKMYDEVKDLIDKNLLHGIEVTNERTYSDQAIQAALDYDLTMLGTSDVHGFVDWDYNIPQGGHRPVTLVFSKRKNLTVNEFRSTGKNSFNNPIDKTGVDSSILRLLMTEGQFIEAPFLRRQVYFAFQNSGSS